MTSTRSVEAGFAALSQAVRRASELWPEYYFGEAVLRLVYDPASPPSSEVLATARGAGLEPAPYAGSDELRAAACDVVTIGGSLDVRISFELPGLDFESGRRATVPAVVVSAAGTGLRRRAAGARGADGEPDQPG